MTVVNGPRRRLKNLPPGGQVVHAQAEFVDDLFVQNHGRTRRRLLRRARGGLCSRLRPSLGGRLGRFGQPIGQALQLADDLIDERDI
ncbi:MAG: hypothetical protein ACYTF6_14380 [Planctomycetota bacterium]